jgi:hypothetical protein
MLQPLHTIQDCLQNCMYKYHSYVHYNAIVYTCSALALRAAISFLIERPNLHSFGEQVRCSAAISTSIDIAAQSMILKSAAAQTECDAAKTAAKKQNKVGEEMKHYIKLTSMHEPKLQSSVWPLA